MAASRVQVPTREVSALPVVLILDDNQTVRDEVASQVQEAFAGRCQVEAIAGREAGLAFAKLSFKRLPEERKLQVAAIVIAWRLEFEEGTANSVGSVAFLRKALGDSAQIILYADEKKPEHEKAIPQAGVSVCFCREDILPAVAQVFVARDLGILRDTLPSAADVLDAIDVGISIQSPQMKVLWANRLTMKEANAPDIVGSTCWEGYHSFENREWPCTGCTAWEVLSKANRRGLEQSGRMGLTGYHLLPIRDAVGRRSIARVEVNAAPCLWGATDRLLAVIEATRFAITEEWEKKPAHERIREVLRTACEMGRQNEQSPPFEFVGVYYGGVRCKETENFLFLFDSAVTKGASLPSRVLRLPQTPEAYRELVANGGELFLAKNISPDGLNHFLRMERKDGSQRVVLIDVAYKDDKKKGLFTHDLTPYWEYVEERFEQAMEDREKETRAKTHVAIRKFQAGTVNGIRGEEHFHKVLQSAADCVREALGPLSMYVRTYNRETNCLEKREKPNEGFGKYFELAWRERLLARNGVGSAWAASERKGLWEPEADLEQILRHLDMDLTEKDRNILKRIVSYVTLPLVYGDRVFGTFNVQFEDDSLMSGEKEKFLRVIAADLGGALAGLEWSIERREVIELSRELDSAMFLRSERPLEDQENAILEKVAPLVFKLTSAEMVVYYRVDAASGKLRLVPHVTKGPIPPGAKPPSEIPAQLGVVGLAVAARKGQFVRDYRAEAWKSIRDGLLTGFLYGPERTFCEWVACEVAQPVIVEQKVHGVFLALSAIPHWLSEYDSKVVSEFAFKTGLALEARQLAQHLSWELAAKNRTNEIRAAMAASSTDEELYRLFILAVTAGECLGFSRAILFLRPNGEENSLAAKLAVGAIDSATAGLQWEEAKGVTLAEMIARCARPLPPATAGDLRCAISGLALDLSQHPDLAEKLGRGEVLQRRHRQPHFFKDPGLQHILTPPDDDDVEYVLAPLKAEGQIIGAVLADRAFLPDNLDPGAVSLLNLVAGEFGLLVAAHSRRRQEDQVRITKDVAWGVSYSLRTQASVLENRLANLESDLGEAHQKQIRKMRKTIAFFSRAGTLAGANLQFEQSGVVERERLDINGILTEIVDVLADDRIELTPGQCPVYVDVNAKYLMHVFLEILVNAQEFVDKVTGKIRVCITSKNKMARVDVVDNGPGVHPEMRAELFQKFACHPASRMGLGLAYANSVILAHYGKIDEIGAKNVGAHFVVTIPLSEEQ